MARDFGFMPAEGPDYYFVSYNSEDADRVAAVARNLADKGVPLWYDCGLAYGEKWEEQITEKIACAKAVILFFTRGILHKTDSYVKKEYRIATKLFDRMVYVVMLDDVQDADVPVSMAVWWTDILERHNIEAADSPDGTAALILQAIGMPAGGSQAAPSSGGDAGDPLPRELSLFELLGIRNISEFDIGRHWDAADPTASIAIPIGVGSDGSRVCLDLHQRKDGPSGIVGGAAGSGKSEFLKTLLLSLALHYPPEHVRFHVIDPFQQGMFDAVRDLPHTGTGLNQESDEAFSAQFAWFEEEKARRDALLAQYGVQNAYQYLKKAKACPEIPPMPHILIVIDSLERLKQMYPDWAFELVKLGNQQSTRRYGFHLVFATGRPAGVIDENLYSCTHFKIFADAYNGQDIPGRMYLQTPVNDSIQQIQLAYSGERALSAVQRRSFEMLDFFNNKSQLQIVVEAIRRFCLD